MLGLQHKRSRMFSATAIVVAGVIFGIGCGPVARPEPPRQPKGPKFRYETIEEAAVSPMILNAHRSKAYSVKVGTKTIAILNFTDHVGSGAGQLVADSYILELQRRGHRVIERERIEKILREQSRIGEGMTGLTDLEIARRIGRLVAADYFLIGAVTEYASDNERIPLSKMILISDIERYEEEADDYEAQREDFEAKCDKWLSTPPGYRVGGGSCEMDEALTIDEWQEEYVQKSREAFTVIARVGLTAKLVDVHSTDILWVGQANVSDLNLQKGMTRIITNMVDDFAPQ